MKMRSVKRYDALCGRGLPFLPGEVTVVSPPFGVLLVTGKMTHQENYGAGFQADPRAQVIGLTDETDVNERRRRLNRQLAQEMDIPFFPDLREALGRSDVHAVSVCSEFERRVRVSQLCAEAGKHLYIDKPMATDMAEAERLVTTVKQRGLRGQMFTQVGLPYAKRLKGIVDSGELGEIRSIQCDLMFSKGFTGGAPLGKPRREHYPPKQFTFPDAKREIWTTAVYSLTLIRWLLGGPRFRSVYATSANYFFEEHYKRDVEDFGTLALELDGGVTASLIAGRIGWHSHPSSGPNFTRLIGAKRSLLFDAHSPRFEITSETSWTPPAKDPLDPMGFWSSTMKRGNAQPKPYWHEPVTVAGRSDQALFLDCLEQEKEAEVTLDDAAQASEAMLAAYQSAATGKVVPLPLPR